VDGDGVPGALGGNGEGDEVQGIEGDLMAWSTRSIASRSDDMGWPDLFVSDAMVIMAVDDCQG
jgi:hypothetical protein